MNFETLVRDMIALRKEYREKTRSGEVHTQSDAIAVCRAFKNKYKLSDSECVGIARGYFDLDDTINLWDRMQKKEPQTQDDISGTYITNVWQSKYAYILDICTLLCYNG